MHAPAYAAIEATLSLQPSSAASDCAAVLDNVSHTNLSAAVAEAAGTDDTGKNPAAVAEAALEIEGIDNPSAAVAKAAVKSEGTDGTSAAVAEAQTLKVNAVDNPSAAVADAAVETEGIGNPSAAVAEADLCVKHAADAADQSKDESPQRSDSSFPASADGAHIHYSLDTLQCSASRADDETTCSQEQSADSEAGAVSGMAADNQDTAASLQATGCGCSGLAQSQSEAKGVLPEENSLSEAALDKMLELQLQRIKDSAVVLPEPAEVLVTDLFDHRCLCCCAVLCCAARHWAGW